MRSSNRLLRKAPQDCTAAKASARASLTCRSRRSSKQSCNRVAKESTVPSTVVDGQQPKESVSSRCCTDTERERQDSHSALPGEKSRDDCDSNNQNVEDYCGGDERASSSGPSVRTKQHAQPREWGPIARWAMKPLIKLTFRRSTVTYFGSGPYRSQSLCYYDVAASPGVHGHVALTFDDAPCRQAHEFSELRSVLRILADFGAKATFMTIGDFIEGHEADLVQLLKDGHELGNHGMEDRSYAGDSAEDFAKAVDACSNRIRNLQNAAGVTQEVKWFRSPHGKYTRRMAQALADRGMTNVMCDTYASCPIVQDGHFIGHFLANSARHGSIVLLHMPERNLREWCITALTTLLEGLGRRGLKPVSVSELANLAQTATHSRF